MTDERYEKAMSLVTGVLDYEHFKDVDLVIEASLYPCFPQNFTCLVILIHLFLTIAGSY